MPAPAAAAVAGLAKRATAQSVAKSPVVRKLAAPPMTGMLEGEAVVAGAEEDAERLDPGEVAGHGGVALADEVGVDVEGGVGEEAEVAVLLAVEVEVVAVAAGEAGVAAGDARVEVAEAEGLAGGAEDQALVITTMLLGFGGVAADANAAAHTTSTAAAAAMNAAHRGAAIESDY
ncbi:Os05g0107201 [Oryza sativa Japonica Group]|uniref:Os05g0107201 protein n=1 Tax=Oryza sativa subsp. japonica TaxID=39947 RepID=C7J2S2_ORYSJ|nr:Os05g0107201 [Oryza sativa Japonica Group]|eukprot:NP_001174170.1 Os05g0107201 [Oryza sativa Japonica Group]